MKKFVIIEKVPAQLVYTFEVEAENYEDAIEIICNGDGVITECITEVLSDCCDDSTFEVINCE